MAKPRKKDEIELFKEWLVERGAELLIATSEWEVVRFRGDGIVSIVYVNKNRRYRFTGRSQSAWDAFKDRSPSFRIGKDLPDAGATKLQRERSVVIRTLIDRDGDGCFYCGAPFGPDRLRTKEHLVAKTHYGPEHISNLFLSCSPCNLEAGHLSAPEKIRMRDRKRRGRGSNLLAEVVTANGNTDPDLIERITRFLTPKEAANV